MLYKPFKNTEIFALRGDREGRKEQQKEYKIRRHERK